MLSTNVFPTVVKLSTVVPLTVFVPFALFYMKEPFRLDYVWAGLCLVGAAIPVNRLFIEEAVSNRIAYQSGY